MAVPEEDMDHAATMRRLYDLINAADIGAFGMMQQLGAIPAGPPV